MSTESPLIHDGSQTVAAANYGNGAGLYGANTSGTTGGSSGSGQFLAVQLSTSAGRTSVLVAATAGLGVYGILQNKPGTGEAADVGIFGITKAIADSTITTGAPLMTGTVQAGRMAVASGSYIVCGIALEPAVVGEVFTMMFFGGAGLYTSAL